ncbi:endoglucanase [Bacillus mesophilus]|uniref:cellulase n=1 Tax=Bacillus mesophilus TaxID=1808955 RepID=A0A6M0QD49_9BACI|nr:glycoside hydrolase family 5 protein [Bacillus mesophilus]MBM7662891.1 endoglucanase [Bacillus mesophilus]NEY73480.1 glycoside hydrolase family 5 protein [Bacillus mesophilus]
MKKVLGLGIIGIVLVSIIVMVFTFMNSSSVSKLSIAEVEGQKVLVDEKGEVVQLRGMSAHGLQWYSSILNENAFAAFKNDWNANVVRLPLYIGENGYAKNPEAMMEKMIKGIDLAIANDLYVIVDWHVHYPGDPNHEDYAGAMDFFKEISSLYPNHPNIIYEVANEPSERGDGVTNDREGWLKVKTYAEPIIKMLRDHGNENLVLVGSPSWSQRPDLAADDPIDDSNTAYTLHFYSGSHSDGHVMNNAKYALENGVAVFVSEFGTSESNGHNGPYIEESDEWLDFLDEHHVSWVNWSASNKYESSAVLMPDTNMDPGEDQVWSDEEITEAGHYIRDRLLGK